MYNRPNVYSLKTYPILSSFKFGKQVSLHLSHFQAGKLRLIEMKVLTWNLSRIESGTGACVLEKSSFNHSMWFFLLTKVHVVTAMVFPVVMYKCESWTMKKAEHQIVDAFELCWRGLFESSLDSKEIKLFSPKGNQPWIFIGRTAAEVEALAIWCEELTHWKRLWW